MEFTGEFFVPGKAGKRIEQDHLARYEFATRFASGKRVLDIACGVGYGARMLRDAGARVTGVDINPELIRYATETYGADDLMFEVGDVCRCHFKSEFDLVTSFETIEHVSDFQAALRCLHDALKPGGTLIVSTPNRPITSPRAKGIEDKPKNRHHVREFTVDEIVAALSEAGFEVRQDDIHGQRLRRMFKNPMLRWLQRRWLKPDLRASAQVRPIRGLVPRYTVIVARRSDP